MKVLPLPCKWPDPRVARMTTYNGSAVSSRRRKNGVPIQCFRASYIDTQIKCIFFLVFKLNWSLIVFSLILIFFQCIFDLHIRRPSISWKPPSGDCRPSLKTLLILFYYAFFLSVLFQINDSQLNSSESGHVWVCLPIVLRALSIFRLLLFLLGYPAGVSGVSLFGTISEGSCRVSH